MTGKEWMLKIAEEQAFWCVDAIDKYPEMLQIMYQDLRRMAGEGNIYGLFLELRYLFEALIRWYVLVGIAYADYHGDTELAASLFDPERSLSFGDWVNAFPRKLAAQEQIGNSSLRTLLENLFYEYEDAKIVRWRNNTVGHGALQQDTSQMFQKELEEKLLVLKQLLEDHAQTASKIRYRADANGSDLYCTIDHDKEFPLAPYIRLSEGEYRLFDSLLDKDKQICAELNYLTGLRTTMKQPRFFELQAKYYGETPITMTDSFDDDVYTEQLEATLQHFHEPQRYWKQQHYINVLAEWMKEHDRGVFLLQAGSGTGKSTFAGYIDGMGKQKLKRQGITCRCYYFSRLSFRVRQEFFQTLQLNFCHVPENETTLQGNLPFIPAGIDGDGRPKAMADFLNAFRKIHDQKFGREKLLLVLDGIDELQPQDTGILNFVPPADALDRGVYILVTCRTENLNGTFQQDFLNAYPFTERRAFALEEENRDLLKKAIQESVTLSGKPLTLEQIDRVCHILNDRFTGLPVIRAVLAQMADFDSALNAADLLHSYLAHLQYFYGQKHFKKVEIVLGTLALAYEPLRIRQIADLAFGTPPAADILAIMKDISPLLLSVRDSEGTKYLLGHPDFGVQLRTEYHEICRERVETWQSRIMSVFDLESSQYEQDTYIAGGMYLWSKDILKKQLLDIALLDNMARIAGYYSQARDTGIHMSRIIRIMSGAKSGYMEHWKASKDLKMAACALDAITTCLHKLLQVEDMLGCEKAQEESEQLIAELPDGYQDDARIVPVLFIHYANRSTLAECFGDLECAQSCHDKAFALLIAHPDWIRNEHQIPFIHNCAVSLLQTNPDASIAICDQELSFPEINGFQRIKALTLKSDALKIKQDYVGTGECLQEAVELARKAVPQCADEVAIYPNTLLHYGRYLINPKQEYTKAIEVLTEALDFCNRRAKHGALPDRYEGARILSEIGNAYYAMDAMNKSAEHREQCLWLIDQSVEVYRVAIKNRLRFQPAAAGPIYLNAAYAHDYYQEPDVALALIDEVESMQNDDPFGADVIRQCAEVRAQLVPHATVP